MATPSFPAAQAPASSAKPHLDKKPSLLTTVIFFAVLGSGLLFTSYSPAAILLSGSLYWLFTQLS
ncbi:hypothetical protein ACYZTR_07640 [Pseudomonas sp. Hz4]